MPLQNKTALGLIMFGPQKCLDSRGKLRVPSPVFVANCMLGVLSASWSLFNVPSDLILSIYQRMFQNTSGANIL